MDKPYIFQLEGNFDHTKYTYERNKQGRLDPNKRQRLRKPWFPKECRFKHSVLSAEHRASFWLMVGNGQALTPAQKEYGYKCIRIYCTEGRKTMKKFMALHPDPENDNE